MDSGIAQKFTFPAQHLLCVWLVFFTTLLLIFFSPLINLIRLPFFGLAQASSSSSDCHSEDAPCSDAAESLASIFLGFEGPIAEAFLFGA